MTLQRQSKYFLAFVDNCQKTHSKGQQLKRRSDFICVFGRKIKNMKRQKLLTNRQKTAARVYLEEFVLQNQELKKNEAQQLDSCLFRNSILQERIKTVDDFQRLSQNKSNRMAVSQNRMTLHDSFRYSRQTLEKKKDYFNGQSARKSCMSSFDKSSMLRCHTTESDHKRNKEMLYTQKGLSKDQTCMKFDKNVYTALQSKHNLMGLQKERSESKSKQNELQLEDFLRISSINFIAGEINNKIRTQRAGTAKNIQEMPTGNFNLYKSKNFCHMKRTRKSENKSNISSLICKGERKIEFY